MDKSLENKILWEIIVNILWMSIRYAHGRNTCAPSIVRDAVNKLRKLNPDFKLISDVVIKAPKHELKGTDIREDYLDDLIKANK